MIEVYTHNTPLKNRLAAFAEEYPSECRLIDDDENGCQTYEIRKGRFGFKLTPPYSQERKWVLAQIFACPCTIFADKAYVGGKGINNSGGNLCDFIYQNSLSQNVALIEIKTPCTELIGNQYRGTYSFSYELSGAINQVLNYRDKLTKEYYSLCHQSSEPFEVLSPKCVVIIGKMASLTPGQVAAFENFRNSLSNVLILTFDELYQRIVDLIAVLSESPNQQPGIFEPETGNEDLPF